MILIVLFYYFLYSLSLFSFGFGSCTMFLVSVLLLVFFGRIEFEKDLNYLTDCVEVWSSDFSSSSITMLTSVDLRKMSPHLLHDIWYTHIYRFQDE